MKNVEIPFSYQLYPSIADLTETQRSLALAAIEATALAYAPYSQFKVGCVAMLTNGETVAGGNQENAAYPMCICAEVATMSACASSYPGIGISKLAIATHSKHPSPQPAAPCGQCRQTLLEYEMRYDSPIELILVSQQGSVIILDSAKALLPLSFSADNLKIALP